jgi:hypothetical protein
VSRVNATVTVAEAVLIHLNRFDTVYPEKFHAPFRLTQDGIASAVGISRAHSSLEIKKLIASGSAERMKVHVEGCPNRRYIHALTTEGRFRAEQIRRELEGKGIDPVSVLADMPAISGTKDPDIAEVEDEIRLAIDSLEKSDRGSVIVHLSNAVRITASGIEVRI